MWPEFNELLATRQITIHKFNLTEYKLTVNKRFWSIH